MKIEGEKKMEVFGVNDSKLVRQKGGILNS
jgi:hypothetical protein